MFVHNLVAEYIVRLVLATRTPAEFNLPDLTSVIQLGCSPRATLGLVAAARALALIHGRDYVLPTDVQSVAKDVMSHRIVLGFDAVADNIQPAQVIDRIIAMVPPPTPVWNGQSSSRGSPSSPVDSVPRSGRRRSRTSAESHVVLRPWLSAPVRRSRLPTPRRSAGVPAARRRSGVPAARRRTRDGRAGPGRVRSAVVGPR